MLLPRSLTAPVQRALDLDRTIPALARDRSILLVDDDDQVRDVTALTLTESGYRVMLVAGDAAAGLAMLDAEHERIGLLIADHAMPGMTGREMLEIVRSRFPGLPFLLATGYADFHDLTGDGLRIEQIVRKPFRVAELLARVDMVCGEAAQQAGAGTG